MIIKHTALALQLKQKKHALYILSGPDNYLLNEAFSCIKKTCAHDNDRIVLHLQTSEDWNLLLTEANSYSLFSDNILIDARLEKKSIESTAKAILQQYLTQPNPRCLIILWAPFVPIKQLQVFLTHPSVLIVQVTTLRGSALQQWIRTQLNTKKIAHEACVPVMIQHYTQGNQWACMQAIERLSLTTAPDEILTQATLKEQLIVQCDYQLYELTDACLSGHLSQAIYLLRLAAEKSEATLLLWLITQEIRKLIDLTHRCQKLAFTDACEQLKIWSSRASLYALAMKRLQVTKLHQLLQQCHHIDRQIKSNGLPHAWRELEQLIMTFC